jgi:hypothetical protein
MMKEFQDGTRVNAATLRRGGPKPATRKSQLSRATQREIVVFHGHNFGDNLASPFGDTAQARSENHSGCLNLCAAEILRELLTAGGEQLGHAIITKNEFQNGGNEMTNPLYTGLPSDQDLVTEPSVSYWFKRALTELSERDIVDAIHDVDLLKAVLVRRIDTAMSNLGCYRKEAN